MQVANDIFGSVKAQELKALEFSVECDFFRNIYLFTEKAVVQVPQGIAYLWRDDKKQSDYCAHPHYVFSCSRTNPRIIKFFFGIFWEAIY